jgi:single-stranded-DNA-specific exonuclease
MKDRHIRLELAQESVGSAARSGVMRCVGWDWAGRCAALALTAGSLVDVAYRIRENDHPDFGGIEIEIAGLQLADA